MESPGTLTLLDDSGKPLSARVQRVLHEIVPRVRNRFPALADESIVAEVLEEAGRRIEDHERVSGPVSNLDAYAWVTVRNVARSKMRRSSMRLVRSTLASEESQTVFDTLPSRLGSPEQIEADILIQELLAQLTPEERLLCARKRLGFSSREIARAQGTSVARVDTLFYRIKRKIRATLRGSGDGAAVSRTTRPTKPRTA